MAKQTKTPKTKGSFWNKVDGFFEISKRGSTFKTEIIAGLTTFFAMAYIVVTNPNQIVSFGANLTDGIKTDMDRIWYSVYVASILVAVIGTLLMALYAKMPFAQACGMGLNSFFFTSFVLPQIIVGGDVIKGYQAGLVIILISGLSTTIHSSSGKSFLVPVIKSVTSDFLFVTLPVYIGFLSILTIDVCTHFDLVFFVLIPLSFKLHAILVVPKPLYT